MFLICSTSRGVPCPFPLGPGALPDRCKRSLSLRLYVAVAPLLAPLLFAVMPLLLPLSFVPVMDQNMNVYSGLARAPVGWTRDSKENSVTGRPILGSARDGGLRMTDLPPLDSALHPGQGRRG